LTSKLHDELPQRGYKDLTFDYILKKNPELRCNNTDIEFYDKLFELDFDYIVQNSTLKLEKP
jgi:hypothetical protein